MPRCGPARSPTAPLVVADRLRRRRSARRRSVGARTSDSHGLNDRTPPVTSPTCSPTRSTAEHGRDPCPDPRRPAGARGLPLAAGRRRGPAEHQRVAVPAAGGAGATRWPPSCRGVEWHRYPDRAAPGAARRDRRLARRVAPTRCSPPTARTRCCRRCCSTYAGPGRTVRHVRADVPAARPHRPGHRRRPSSRASGGPTSRSTRRGARGVVAAHRPTVTFLCSPNNPTGLVETRRRSSTLRSRAADGLVVVDEAYAQFADWTALDLVADDRPLVVVRTFSKTWSMAAARLGYLVGPSWLVAELDKVVLPYHLDAAKQIAGTLALRSRRRDGRPGRQIVVDERERLVEALRRPARRRVPERRQLRAVPRRRR